MTKNYVANLIGKSCQQRPLSAFVRLPDPKCHHYVTIYGTVNSLLTSSQPLTISFCENGDISQHHRRQLYPLPRAAETQSLGENDDPKLGQDEGQTGNLPPRNCSGRDDCIYRHGPLGSAIRTNPDDSQWALQQNPVPQPLTLSAGRAVWVTSPEKTGNFRNPAPAFRAKFRNRSALEQPCAM